MELDECFAKLVIQDQPENAMDRGARIGDALSEATQKWFHEYFPLGPSDSAKQDLVDTWIQILCIDFGDNNPLWDNWLAFVFLAWGDHWLPEIIAEFLDGEAEQIVDELYADFATELPRYQVLSRISFLESSLKHCVEAPPEPHRPAVNGGLGALRHPKTTSRVYQPVPRAYGCQEAWLQHLRQCTFLDLPVTPFCPRYKSIQEQPVFLVVHLFSGRRREGDFHQALHQLAETSNWKVVILSLDTAVSTEYGNLMTGTTSWQTLSALSLSGRVAATLCGPPCETFSEARYTPAPPGETLWPRPLRSFDRLFGLEGLTFRELKQCAVGSSFFLQTIWILCIHIQCGGLFVAEHPARPADASRPSIWTSPIVQLLLMLPELQLHHVAQYQWGAEAVKPTGLLALAMPFFRCDLYKKAFSDAVKPTSAAIGKNPNGEFNTSRHKEYPGRFCLALAFTFANQFNRLLGSDRIRAVPHTAQDLDEWVEFAAKASTPIRTGAQWLPDFQNL